MYWQTLNVLFRSHGLSGFRLRWQGRPLLTRLARWAWALKRDLHAIYLACRSPHTPWYVKFVTLLAIGYALSPIDLIPDFVPVLAPLDDLVLVPLGILLVIRLLPAELLAECRNAAEAAPLPRSWIGGAVVAAIWLLIIAITASWIAGVINPLAM